ncbi:hypothetical protein [Psychromicrobium lacuslunae]|uniref:4-hydroxybenzoate polyprenyltransferase n=1 Tax=Psychromicrobium lacuslunae TaxID=1618207 RepID=A0A0D4BXV2_9MICC|nr:hypothetical protein [Psychromicrobium lacuslunae]AJT41129.1 hypothetical protein UM93_05630 [Psychromicrobium lacuslunae]
MLSQLAGAATIVVAEHEAPAELFMPFWMFGVSIFAILLILMLITVSFTNLGNRHEAVEETIDPNKQHTNKHDHGQGRTASHR